MHPRNGRGLVFFPFPLQGHVTPMLQLAQILHSRGFHVTIIHTQFNSPDPSNYPHFTFLPILDDGSSDGALSGSGINRAVDLVSALNKACAGLLHDLLARVSDDARSKGEPVACFITDPHWNCTRAVADALRLPRLVVRTTSFVSFHVFSRIPVLRDNGYFYLSEIDAHSTNDVPEVTALKFKDIPKFLTSDPEGLAKVLGDMVAETKASSGIIWNSFKELEEYSVARVYQEFHNPSFIIGPFNKYYPTSSSSLLEQDRSIFAWLDEQAPKSLLYVSFGSIVRVKENDFLEMAWGLANSKQPFLWAVRQGSILGSEWTEVLPSELAEELSRKGRIVKWCPQQEVLAHPATGGFLSHCGWNSTLESICEGVPMLCAPSFSDQLPNARYVTDVLKVGVMLEDGLKRGEIESGIKRLMVDKEGEEIRERMMWLKEKVNVCIKEGGSSYESLESLVQYILSF